MCIETWNTACDVSGNTNNEVKKNEKHIVGAVPKSNHKIVERGENQHPLIATSI